MMKLLKGRQLKAALKEVFGPIKREKWDDLIVYHNLDFRCIQVWERDRALHIHFRYKGEQRCYEDLCLILDLGYTDGRLSKVLSKLDKLGIKY